MGVESEWVLNGSMADKSMVRNYLAYRTASQFMPFTPDSGYCEVLRREGGQYYYDGVYLLIESVKHGPNRIDIPKSSASAPFPSYIVRRDRYDENANTLDTWLTRNGITNKYISLIYPSRAHAGKKVIQYAAADISKIEEILYSENTSVFSSYHRTIDVDSFVDYFLFNEFFGSYDAGAHSTYMYKLPGGKLKIGPVWDLDNALDNYIAEPLNVQVTAFQQHLYFNRLILDADFLSRLEKRYAQLRREGGPLNDEVIYKTLDSVTAHLGPAIDREWYRWGFIYSNPPEDINHLDYVTEDGTVLVRETKEYQQEIYRLKTSLLQHGKAIGPYLRVLEDSTVYNTNFGGSRDLFLAATLMVFAIPLLYVSRR
jgi:hypothetical protein